MGSGRSRLSVAVEGTRKQCPPQEGLGAPQPERLAWTLPLLRNQQRRTPRKTALLPALNKMEGPPGALTSMLVSLTLYHQLVREKASYPMCKRGRHLFESVAASYTTAGGTSDSRLCVALPAWRGNWAGCGCPVAGSSPWTHAARDVVLGQDLGGRGSPESIMVESLQGPLGCVSPS